MKRILLLAAFGLMSGAALAQTADAAFSFSTVDGRARDLASRPYQPRASRLPASLANLNYDQHRDIRFRRDHSYWLAERLPFQLQFTHPGFILRHTVQVNEVVAGVSRPIAYDPALFDYGANRNLGTIPADLGFAGVRILSPLNRPDHFDELIVFQGASYFRALGKALHYGLSARGLALNSGEPTPEEFPVFEEFWIERPALTADAVVIHALMDSPSVAGAYRFSVNPGDATVVDVQVSLHFRAGAQPGVIGLAPLTSMFWYGENSGTTHGDFRPEVHDSDGLAIARGNGEWLWRPLVNPRGVRSTAFLDENPKGFGLIQRDRAFESYQDLEAYYQLRPSAWIEPVGNWGRGSVRLVELPTPNETEDNIVAFWVPEEKPQAGKPFTYRYRLHWFQEGKGGAAAPSGRAVATRIGKSQTQERDWVRFTVDFEGGPLAGLPKGADVEADVTVTGGAELKHHTAVGNRFTKGWRAAFAILPDGSGKPVELRCYLRNRDGALTETWTYLWSP